MTDNTIAHFEMSDSTANVHDLPCTVCAEEEDPGEQKATIILFHPINRVDGYRTVLMTISFSWGEERLPLLVGDDDARGR